LVGCIPRAPEAGLTSRQLMRALVHGTGTARCTLVVEKS
jgi:hypothetical protein